MRAIKTFIESQRTASTPFDLAFGGDERGPDWEQERDHIRAMTDAGATWWNEFIEPRNIQLDEVRARIARGPLRID